MSFLKLLDIFLQFLLVYWIVNSGVQERPSVEVFHILSFDLRQGSILEPFHQVSPWVWNVFDAPVEEFFPFCWWKWKWMDGWTLENPSPREVN
jgi:hypothetical protein